MRVQRVVLVLAAVGMLLGLAAPTAAEPPERFDFPITPTIFDGENDLGVFINITRDAFCTDEMVAFEEAIIAWLDGGMQDPFPDEPEPTPGFDLVSIQRPVIRTGAVVSYGSSDDLYIELWNLDSPDKRGLVGPCLDTDDDGSLFASGRTTWQFHASDLAGTGTRGDQVSLKAKATVTDTVGAEYRYSFFIHDNLECAVREDGSPACLVFNTRLAPAN